MRVIDVFTQQWICQTLHVFLTIALIHSVFAFRLRSSSSMTRTHRITDHLSTDSVELVSANGSPRRSPSLTERDLRHADGTKLSPTSRISSALGESHNRSDTEFDCDGRWYRFNDTSVEPVELNDELLEHECFGGTYKVVSSDGKLFFTSSFSSIKVHRISFSRRGQVHQKAANWES